MPWAESFAVRIGVLRLAIAGLVLGSLPLVFFQGVDLAPPWNVVIGQVTPAVVLMTAWVIPLDILMARIFMVEQEESIRARYRYIIKFDVCLLIILLAAWAPFFVRLVS